MLRRETTDNRTSAANREIPACRVNLATHAQREIRATRERSEKDWRVAFGGEHFPLSSPTGHPRNKTCRPVFARGRVRRAAC